MESQRAPSESVQCGHDDASVESSGVVSVRDVRAARDIAARVEVTPATVDGSASASQTVGAPRERRWLRVTTFALTVVGALGAFVMWRANANAVSAPTVEQALAKQLRARGLTLDPANVAWLSSKPNWLGVRSALVSAQRGRELHDIYYADVRVSGRSVLDVYSLTNVTRTSSADETMLLGQRTFVAYAARVGDGYDALVVVDTRGEPRELTRGWPWYAKLQNAITNYQDTGRTRAFGIRRYRFLSPVTTLEISASNGLLRGVADGQPLVIAPRHAAPLLGSALAKFERSNKGQPGTITWLVDTVRRVPSIGRAPIEWLEHEVFGITDRVTRAYHEFVQTDTAAEVKQALSGSALPNAPAPSHDAQASRQVAASTTEAAVAAVEPEPAEQIGWPPAALAPVLTGKEQVAGEGEWLGVEHDAFVATNPNGPPLFYQTFIRVDAERAYTRVYVTLWDPRQVQLGMVMGTKEPESATGETGNGVIPRDPYVLSHLVGAFNGGFQAMHGEFGMMAGKRVYLPPKPYAATVAVFEDGTTGMGSWPGPGAHTWDESFANSQIPKDMLAMRQNLTSVVEGDTFNPWQRWWWGAAPEWAAEQTYIHRSGLCVTSEGFMGYFWGESMGPAELGKAMHAARCVRGMHLDMNGKHTGFEFYQPFAKADVLPDLGRALRPTEFEGAVNAGANAGNDAGSIRYRSRLAVSTMSPMRFPRYIGQDPRDYFYLTRKPTLPGADLLQSDGSTVAFSTRGLPSTGFPRAFARARLGERGTLVRVDLTRAVPKSMAHEELTQPLAYLINAQAAPDNANTSALYAQFQYGRLRAQIGKPSAGSVTLATGPLVSENPDAQIGLGIDAEGFLVYAEAQADKPGALADLLRAAGVQDGIVLVDGRLALQTDTGAYALDGSSLPAKSMEAAENLALLGESRPAARVLFDDVTPMPYRKWGGMQDQRVRYFPSHPARFQAPGSGQ